jgi:hypothetical protein
MTNPYTLGYQDGLNYRRDTDALPSAHSPGRKVEVERLARIAMRRHMAMIDPLCTALGALG